MKPELAQWIGILAGVCTAVSLVPQIVKITREKKSEDISFVYLSVLLEGLVLWVIYGFVRRDIPLIVTNIVSVMINLVTLFVGLKYKKQSA